MGQQLRKVIKRRRRNAYLQRRKARRKAGIVIGKSAKSAKAEAEKKPAKKAPVKKAKPAAKKAAEAPAAEPVEAAVAAPAPVVSVEPGAPEASQG